MTKKQELVAAPVKRIIDAYHTAFVARHKVKPLISGGKDGALVKKMVATWGEDRVLALVPKFVASNDSWVVRRGWTLAAFYEVAQRLLTAAGGTRTSANLDAAAAATGRQIQEDN